MNPVVDVGRAGDRNGEGRHDAERNQRILASVGGANVMYNFASNLKQIR